MRTSFKYYVVYYYTRNRIYGLGKANIKIKEELNDSESIKEVESILKDKNNFNTVILLNWKLLK